MLKLLHADAVLNGAKLDALRAQSTEAFIQTLSPGGRDCLKTRPDGTVLDGHHRLQVLIERGVDVHSLPREIHKKEGFEE